MKPAALSGSRISEVVLATAPPDAVAPFAAWYDGISAILGSRDA